MGDAAPSPGWMQAPDGKTRWWTGTEWGPVQSSGSAQPAPQLPGKPAPGSSLGCFGCLGIVVLIAIVGGIIAAIGAGSRDDSPASLSVYSARSVCEDAVKNQLKAPATAGFEWLTETAKGTLTYELIGSVDAENGFGALIRTQFSCTATLTGDTVRGRATLLN